MAEKVTKKKTRKQRTGSTEKVTHGSAANSFWNG